MSKIVAATCQAGVVKVGAVIVPGVTVLSSGVGPSNGILILDEDKKYYVCSSALDLKSDIESMVGILNQVITVLTGLDAVTVAPGSMTGAIAALTLLKTQYALSKDILK